MLDSYWLHFKKNIELINRFKKRNVKKLVDAQLKRIDLLHEASFFRLYGEFGIESTDFQIEFAHYVDTDEEYMKSAAEVYFLQFYGNNPENPEFEVKFEEKSNPGAQVSSNK